MLRRSNLPPSYADNLYSSDDLLQTVTEMLADSDIYKTLWFYKPQLVEKWETDRSQEMAEVLAKYLIRMASRTTINQQFGVMMTDRIVHKEKYFLSTDYLKVYYTKKLLHSLENNRIYYRLGNLLRKDTTDYSINSYIGNRRSTVTIQKDTAAGKLIGWIDSEVEVSANTLYLQAVNNGFTRKMLIKVLETLYSLKAIATNIDMEALSFRLLDKTEEKRQQKLFLRDDEIEELSQLIQKIEGLNRLEKDEFLTSVKEINDGALALLESPFEARILDGYRRDYSSDFPNQRFSMSKRTKQLFEVLGAVTTGAELMERFKQLFIDRYGLFQVIPLLESISLYEEIRKRGVISQEGTRLKQLFEVKLRTAQIKRQSTLELSEEVVDEILSLKQEARRINDAYFELKYQKYGRDIVLSELSFFHPGALSCAYLEREEMDCYTRGMNTAALYYSPNYLSGIGCPRGLDKTERIRLDTVEKEDLAISSLGIMADFDGIHLVDRKSKRKILPFNPTMKSFEFSCESVVMEFLEKLGLYLVGMPSAHIPIDFHSWSFIPQIRYKNIILQKRRWLIEKSEFVDKRMSEIRSEREICRYVSLLTEKGEGRYLDLDSDLALKWLDAYTQNHQFILLEEFFHQEGYCLDYVMPVVFYGKRNAVCSCYYQEKPFREKNIELNYSSWHLCYRSDKKRRLEQELLKYVKKSGKAFFYIHYMEEDRPIIRFRIRNDDLVKSRQFFEELTVIGILSDFSLHRYEPETVRYGGKDYIEKFEDIFERESEISILLQRDLQEKDIMVYRIAVIMAMLTNILPKQSISTILSWYMKEDKEVVKYYRQNKQSIQPGLKVLIEKLQKEFYEIDQRIKSLFLNIRIEDSNYAGYILLSVLHMRLNRLVGVSVSKEELSFRVAALLWNKQLNGRKSEW